ncbi:MAG TPA: quinone oxidoreductase, partial [Polyangiaceae bacterium]|nr:quinone oxidoreductase [Polyangiaceae bacterium]
GLYPLPLPSGLGQEAAGVVEAVGAGVTTVAPGDRVAYASLLGAYADKRVAPADRLVKLPDAIADDVAAAAFLKGMTARYLLKATHETRPGEVFVVHAAAGGTGQLLVAWATSLGARVVAVVGTEEKAAIARALGAAETVVRGRDDLEAAVLRISGGRGADVVYDSVGKDTFTASIGCLRPRGLLVSFGQSSGTIPPFEVSVLQKKCLYLTRPSLHVYTKERAELEETANDLFAVLASGTVRAAPTERLPLREAGRAHADLASKKTTGSMILVPS